jgi:hypothetical protein
MGVLIFGYSPVKRAAGIDRTAESDSSIHKAYIADCRGGLSSYYLAVEIVEGRPVRFFKLSNSFDWLRLRFATSKREDWSP